MLAVTMVEVMQAVQARPDPSACYRAPSSSHLTRTIPATSAQQYSVGARAAAAETTPAPHTDFPEGFRCFADKEARSCSPGKESKYVVALEEAVGVVDPCSRCAVARPVVRGNSWWQPLPSWSFSNPALGPGRCHKCDLLPCPPATSCRPRLCTPVACPVPLLARRPRESRAPMAPRPRRRTQQSDGNGGAKQGRRALARPQRLWRGRPAVCDDQGPP